MQAAATDLALTAQASGAAAVSIIKTKSTVSRQPLPFALRSCAHSFARGADTQDGSTPIDEQPYNTSTIAALPQLLKEYLVRHDMPNITGLDDAKTVFARTLRLMQQKDQNQALPFGDAIISEMFSFLNPRYARDLQFMGLSVWGETLAPRTNEQKTANLKHFHDNDDGSLDWHVHGGKNNQVGIPTIMCSMSLRVMWQYDHES